MNRLQDHRRLLNTWIIRASVTLCVGFILAGLLTFFLHGEKSLLLPAGPLWQILSDSWKGAEHGDTNALLGAGLLILLLTPMSRLLAGVYVSVRMRDWLYAGIGATVTVLVLLGWFAGQVAG